MRFRSARIDYVDELQKSPTTRDTQTGMPALSGPLLLREFSLWLAKSTVSHMSREGGALILKNHRKTRILQDRISGIPLVLGLLNQNAGSSSSCGLLGP